MSTLCSLRHWVDDDAQTLATLANDAGVAEYMRHRFPVPYTTQDARQWVESHRSCTPETHFAILVCGALAGSIGMEVGTDIYRGSAEIGYWLGRPFWGRGVATCAVRLLTEQTFATTSLHRLWAGVMAPNVRSMQVLERAGYTREAVLRSGIMTRAGAIVDDVIYARLRDANAANDVL